MLSIDEAIAHAREVAKRNREQWKNCPADIRDLEHQTCEQCAKEHEQLAEWLEELKELREYFNSTEIGKYRFQKGYNKAIDDFVKFASDMPTVEEEDGEMRPMWLEEIAENLKAGGENDNLRR